MSVIKNIKNIKYYLRYAFVFAIILIQACSTTQDVPETEPGLYSNDIKMIQENYTPPDCMSATFSLRIESEGNSRNASGSLYADTTNDSMRIKLSDPYFGIPVSTVIVSGDKVFIDNAGQVPRVLPLGNFEVSGLSNNRVILPFRLFQDLLFGRVPGELFKRGARRTKQDETLTITLTGPGEDYKYSFKSNRLTNLAYERHDTGDRIEGDLSGSLSGSIYPEVIELRGGTGENLKDKLILNFRRIRPESNCNVAMFQIP